MDKLRFLVESLVDYQKDRIRSGNRLLSLPEELKNEAFFRELEAKEQGLEVMLSKEIGKEVKKEEIYVKYLKKIKGIGPIMSGYLLAWLAKPREFKIQGITKKVKDDVYKQKKKNETISLEIPEYGEVVEENLKDRWIRVKYFPVMTVATNPSKLHKYCGIIPDSRLKRGEATHFNPRLKTLMFKILTQLMKAKGQYYATYLRKKREYDERCPEPEKGTKKLKVHLTAKNMTMRIFLTNYWKVFRKLNNLPITDPYPGLMGHDIEPPFIETPEGVEYLDWVDKK